MKRREFIKMGLGAAALAAVPSCVHKLTQGGGVESVSGGLLPAANHALAPRRCELFDFDWRFKPLAVAELKDAVALNKWAWTKEQPGRRAEQMSNTDLDTSGPDWHTANTDRAQMDYVGHAWFRTVLPELGGPGRTVSFTHVDDNGEIYLNGNLLDSHKGWSSPFTVNLDSAWKADGPNVLVVRVDNTDGQGGIYGDVLLGRVPESEELFSPDLDDSSWRQVQLPHDYIVEGEYSPEAGTGHGALPVYSAWYRRKFSLDAADSGKCVWLYFEGVFRQAKIYVNGKLISRHPDGYTSFHVDLSNAVVLTPSGLEWKTCWPSMWIRRNSRAGGMRAAEFTGTSG